ncbi:MAG: hypothetical protein NTZ85_02550 [Bacteroidia bacterium]|nr:hypothetical protein [Bacteroidia bacterium]
MKTLSSDFFIIIIFVLSSCSTSKMLTSNLRPNEVTDLLYLEPVSHISLIEHGNIGILNDSLSDNSKQLLNNIVHDFKNNISLTGEIILTNNAIKLRLEKEIEHLYLTANNLKSISNIKITPVIDSLLESNNKRFGLITVASGYTRTQSNYEAHQAIHTMGWATHILTKGIFPIFPPGATNAFSSTLYVMIVDANQNNIVFYRKSGKGCDPTDKNVLTNQFRKIFEGYFF